jgi:hypothetical protein
MASELFASGVPRIGNLPHVFREYPSTSAASGTGPRTTITMAQGPVQPWANDEEGEEYTADPKAFLLKRCADFMNNIKLMHNWLTLATYWLPPFVTLPNGTRFYRTDKSMDEAMYQGKCGLVIAKGKLAFVDDPAAGVEFKGQNVEIGDWVYFDFHDGRQCTINRVHCRHLKDVSVLGTTDNPELVY